MQANKAEILVVEDNDDDFEATFRALCCAGADPGQLYRRRDGAEAWQDLVGRAEGKAPLPALILLDLNTPGMDGRMLLERLCRDPGLRRIPLVVLTTSDNEVDIETCYRNGANTYLRKTSSWTEFAEAMRVLMAYWFKHARLPVERMPQ